ncbi:MAG: phage tail tip lysozyme [Candidatus Saccharibacteria bacterium]|nr:phage tail tip lysozyme [Candidatus Saccharibacteria bacterium]
MKSLKTIFSVLMASVLIAQPAFAALPSDDVLDMYDTNNIYYYNPNGSDDMCGAYATKLSGDTIEEKVWNYYIDQGFSDIQVAGILGNAKAETGVEPTRSSTGAFYGLFQWHTGYNQKLLDQIRQAGLGKYLEAEWWPSGKSKDIPQNDLDHLLQIELDYTMNGYAFDWISEVKKQSTVEAAAEAFLAIFERAVNGDSPILYYEPYAGLLYQGTSKRRDYAKEYYAQYSGKGSNVSTNLSNTENGANVTIIGDSITVASNNALLEQFPEITQADINAQNGRRWDEGINIARNFSNIKDTVVFALGANSSSLTAANIDEAIQAIGTSRNIVFVTDWATWNEYESNNQLFFDYAKNNSNITVADWKKEVKGKNEQYFSDSIHPNSEGAKLFAKIIYDAVNSNSRDDNCSVNGEFSSLVKAYAWPEHHSAPFTNRMPAYANAVSQSISEGRYVGGSVDGVPGIDCGGFVTILTQNSGLDPKYNSYKGATGAQEDWVKANNWTLLNGSPNRQVDTSILQAGDIAFSNGHTFIYVGEIAGFDSKIASASYSSHGNSSARAPMAGREDLLFGNGSIVRWYRNPQFTSNNTLNYQSNLQNKVWSTE